MWLKSFFTTVAVLAMTVAAQAQICIPTVTVQNGVAVNIGLIDTNGDGMTDLVAAQVQLSDFLVAARNHCDNKPLRFGLRKAGQGAGMPTDTVVQFKCDELGQQNVEVWVRNAQGLMNMVQTYVFVLNYNACGGNPPAVSTACTPDVLAPTIIARNGLATYVRIVGDNPLGATVHVSQFVATVRDNCGGPFEYRIRKAGQGTGVPSETEVTFNCANELGQQNVEIWVGDASGNWAYALTYVVVQDNFAGTCDDPPTPVPAGCSPDQTRPYLVVRDGLAQSINYPEGGKHTRVYVNDFIVTATDECSPFVDIRISKASQNPTLPPPGQTHLLFTCNELGQQNVEIWLMDAAGNWTFVQTYILIQDNDESC